MLKSFISSGLHTRTVPSHDMGQASLALMQKNSEQKWLSFKELAMVKLIDSMAMSSLGPKHVVIFENQLHLVAISE